MNERVTIGGTQRPRPAGARAPGALALGALALAVGVACSDPRFHRRPADTVFSVGVADGAAGPPQASGPLALQFGEGASAPGTVVAVRLDRAPAIDGDAADWASVPSSQVPLTGAAARVELDEAEFLCRYRSRLALAVDPFTGAPGCPSACAPGSPPATREEASAGCTLPFPRFDHGVAAVAVRAAYDEARLYLLLQWSDPTEDRAARTWRYDAGAAAAWIAGAEEEDWAAVSFDAGPARSAHASRGCAAACHLAGPVAAPPPTTLPDLVPPAYLAQFTMHTDADGERVDAWEWRAGRTDAFGLADDLVWNARRGQGDCRTPPACLDDCLLAPPGPACTGDAAWTANAREGAPRALAAGASGLGDPDLDPPLLFVAGQGLPGWDARFAAVEPEGAFPAPASVAALPGFVLQASSPHRDDVTAVGQWRDGVWTVELSRPLVTGDAGDAQFPLR